MRSQLALVSLAFSALSLTAACGPSAGGQIGGEALHCIRIAETPLAADETSPFGFSPDSVLAYAEGTRTRPFTWAKGGATDVTVTVTHAGQARYVEREYQDDGSGAESAWECDDIVEIDVLMAVSTADGTFAESWMAPLQVDAARLATMQRRFAPEALQGSFDFTTVDSESYNSVEIIIDAMFEPEAAFGEVWAVTYKETETANTHSKVDIATF